MRRLAGSLLDITMRKIDEGVAGGTSGGSGAGLLDVMDGMRIVGEALYWRKRFLEAHLMFQRGIS